MSRVREENDSETSRFQVSEADVVPMTKAEMDALAEEAEEDEED